MRNKAGFYTASLNMREAVAQGRKPYAQIPQSLLKACGINWRNYDVEWHHNGARIAFFPSDSSKISKIDSLILEIKKVEKQKAELFYKSKAEAMRAVKELPDCKYENPLAIRLKEGKYGWFVCTNKIYFSPSDTFKRAKNTEQKRAIESLFE